MQKKEGKVLLATFTARHSLDHSLSSVMTAIREASTAARAGGQWQGKIRVTLQAVGTLVDHHIRWSPNFGWHYHQHLSIACLTTDEKQIREGAQALIARYRAELEKRNFDADAEQWFALADCEPDSPYTYPADHHREDDPFDRNGEIDGDSLSPFQIAELAATGDEKMIALWQEYATAVHGMRSAVVTKGMAAALDIEPTVDHGPTFDDSNKVGSLSSIVWSSLLDQGLRGTFLTRLEIAGKAAWPSVHAWAHAALPWESPPVDDDDAASRQAIVTSLVNWRFVLDRMDDPDCKQFVREEIVRDEQWIGARYSPDVCLEMLRRAQLRYHDHCPDNDSIDLLLFNVMAWVEKLVRRRRPEYHMTLPMRDDQPPVEIVPHGSNRDRVRQNALISQHV